MASPRLRSRRVDPLLPGSGRSRGLRLRSYGRGGLFSGQLRISAVNAPDHARPDHILGGLLRGRRRIYRPVWQCERRISNKRISSRIVRPFLIRYTCELVTIPAVGDDSLLFTAFQVRIEADVWRVRVGRNSQRFQRGVDPLHAFKGLGRLTELENG